MSVPQLQFNATFTKSPPSCALGLSLTAKHQHRLQFRPRVLIRAAAEANQPEERLRPSEAPAREQAEVQYKDGWTDIAFIGLCRKAYGNIAGWQSPRGWKDGRETYKGMVEVSKAMMKVGSNMQGV